MTKTPSLLEMMFRITDLGFRLTFTNNFPDSITVTTDDQRGHQFQTVIPGIKITHCTLGEEFPVLDVLKEHLKGIAAIQVQQRVRLF